MKFDISLSPEKLSDGPFGKIKGRRGDDIREINIAERLYLLRVKRHDGS